MRSARGGSCFRQPSFVRYSSSLYRSERARAQGILFQFSFLLLVVYLLGVIPIKKQHDKISYWSSPKSNNLIFIIHLLFVYIPLLFEADMIDPTNKKILYNLTGFFILIFIWVVGQKLCEIPDLK